MTRRSAARAKTMSQIRPWQAALFVVAILVLGGSVVLSMMGSRGVRNANSVVMVDVKTGDLFEFSVSGHMAVFVPEMNPETGQETLLSVYRDDEGAWRLTGGSISALQDLQKQGVDTSAVGDGRGPLQVSDRSVQTVRKG
ncbi:MAG: hypothetical protein R3B49_10240 [Phycisphaerales bacterium]